MVRCEALDAVVGMGVGLVASAERTKPILCVFQSRRALVLGVKLHRCWGGGHFGRCGRRLFLRIAHNFVGADSLGLQVLRDTCEGRAEVGHGSNQAGALTFGLDQLNY